MRDESTNKNTIREKLGKKMLNKCKNRICDWDARNLNRFSGLSRTVTSRTSKFPHLDMINFFSRWSQLNWTATD